MQLDQLLDCSGSVLLASHGRSFGSPRINSRDVTPGDVFIALKDKRDGWDFVDDALERGASAVLLERPHPAAQERVTVVQVPDTLIALRELGINARRASSASVIAVTGSAGKTTTKSFIAAVLGDSFTVVSSEKSFNNHLGVPLTLLAVDEDTTHLVAEIGTNARGEIGRLSQMVSPDIAVLTNVGHAHIGNFASQRELADEKTDLFRHLRPGGVAVVNGDDPVIAEALERRPLDDGTRLVRVGFDPANDVWVSDVVVTAAGTSGVVHSAGQALPFELPGLLGRHLAYAVAITVALAQLTGIELSRAVRALATVELPTGRSAVFSPHPSLLVIDDSYNGSPDATSAALETLGAMEAATRVAVIGEMRELGEHSESFHRRIGELAGERATEVIAIGDDAAEALAQSAASRGARTSRYRSAPEAIAHLASTTTSENAGATAVLLKGARFMHLERIRLALEGAEVRCNLGVCTLYINCGVCDHLTTGGLNDR